MKYEQLVLVEFRNSEPFVYRVRSNIPITIPRVARHFITTEGFNPARDSFTFLDDAPVLVLGDEPEAQPIEHP